MQTYFDKPKATYITKGIAERIPTSVQMLIWCIIEETKQKVKHMDYLQVFELKTSLEENQLEITHFQEEPDFLEEVVYMPFDKELNEKLYLIDDVDHITMLLAEEY